MTGAAQTRYVRFLLDQGLAIDEPVGRGIEKNLEPALLSWLVRHGASADIEDRTGASALRRASRKRDQRYLAALSQ